MKQLIEWLYQQRMLAHDRRDNYWCKNNRELYLYAQGQTSAFQDAWFYAQQLVKEDKEMKTKKGDLTYTDGVMKIIIKRKYAYYYNLKTDGLVSKAEVDDHLFTRIKKAGFKRQELKQECSPELRTAHQKLLKKFTALDFR